jgi:hypothetical protein
MPPDGTETEYPESPLESESGGRPYGLKPYGLKPYGLKPYGLKPYGLKPYGLKPYGLKPYGLKPYGLKPYGLKGELDEAAGEEWSAQIAELVTERSAALRLGATVVSAEDNRDVPVLGPLNPAGTFPVVQLVLGSQAQTVNMQVVVPNRNARDFADHPELADPLKADIAEHLALALDRGVLAIIPRTPGAGDLLQRHRRLVRVVQAHPLRNPGWIIHRRFFDRLSRLPTANTMVVAAPANRSLDSYAALQRDGADGGRLFGFPVITSSVGRTLFSADWSELWIGVERSLVNIAVSQEGGFAADVILIRATMNFGSLLRRPAAFARL